jgi:predicted YcjX-like family ATPase
VHSKKRYENVFNRREKKKRKNILPKKTPEKSCQNRKKKKECKNGKMHWRKYTATRQEIAKTFFGEILKSIDRFFLSICTLKEKKMENVKIRKHKTFYIGDGSDFERFFKLLFPSISRLMAIMSKAGILGFSNFYALFFGA